MFGKFFEPHQFPNFYLSGIDGDTTPKKTSSFFGKLRNNWNKMILDV